MTLTLAVCVKEGARGSVIHDIALGRVCQRGCTGVCDS